MKKGTWGEMGGVRTPSTPPPQLGSATEYYLFHYIILSNKYLYAYVDFLGVGDCVYEG